ncbi:hypothetical protein FRC11_005249 [Ceratobasidium sp. 423]|nr:hypothetical protein FRC11_005249 [Ceratobasidium sp. 423]
MADHPRWYPPGQTYYPPKLPTFLKNVHDLKPIVRVPSDDEVIGIHAVIQAARKVSEVPGMHDPDLIMKLNDHLFGVQMVLPTHLTANLGPVHGAPSDEEMMKVQDAFQTYQEFRRVPSMFDAHVNMELSQHLFDIQMGENPPHSTPQATASVDSSTRNMEYLPNRADEETTPTNNAGTGANATEVPQTPHLAPRLDMRELMERSNRLAEQFNRLLERSNELVERSTKPADSQSQTFAERFNQVLERLTQLVEQSRQPAEQSDRLAERFNQLFEQFNHLTEQSNQPAQRTDQLAEQLNRSSERSNQLSEQANKSWERLGNVLSHKGNKISALDCLVNEEGETPAISGITGTLNFVYLSKRNADDPKNRLPVMINGDSQDAHIRSAHLGKFIQFYGIDNGMCKDATSVDLNEGMENKARERLREYLSSCLG